MRCRESARALVSIGASLVVATASVACARSKSAGGSQPETGSSTSAAPPPTLSSATPSAAGASDANRAAPSRPPAAGSTAIVESVYAGGLKSGWSDWGWATGRETTGPGPARVKFASWGGLILAKPGLEGSFGALVFRVKTPPGEAEFLEVHLESGQSKGPQVLLRPEHRTHAADGWDDVRVPMEELDPDGSPFDRVTLRAVRAVPDAWTLLDKIGFTRGEPFDAAARLRPGFYAASKTRTVTMTVSAGAKATRISPLVYGIAYNFQGVDKDPQQWAMNATARRWGGNPTTRYNWQLHAWNITSDWFFENVGVSPYTKFLADDAAHGMKSALTVPIMGWVAKDATSMSFPVSVFGAQERTDPYKPEAGNGTTKDGKKIPPGPPTRTSVAIDPAFVKRWVEAIRQADARTGKRSVDQYILDNEPALWQNTHRDVRPAPLGYDELVERTIQYGTAVRQADPDAVIAGPAEWGWLGYIYSGKDGAAGFTAKPDRLAHGDVPLIEWYLQKLREHEQRTGVRVLDLVDLHYYPQEENVYGGGQGGTDAKTAALRIRSTRSLWDPDYAGESWIKEKIRLVPRMKEWIAKSYPGRGISIGEWSFGGEGHMSGALATAEALGRFGALGVTSAFYWTYPPAGSPVINAFLAYRNFDGKGGRFLDYALPASVTPNGDDALASLFASRDEEGKHVVLVALNTSPDTALTSKIDLPGCGPLLSRQTFVTLKGAQGFLAGERVSAAGGAPASFEQFLPPYSITVIDIRLAGAMPGSVER